MNKISESEEMVMTVIWEQEDAPDLMTTLKAVNERYEKERKPQTVSTFIHRLIEKGFLVGNRKGRYTYYSPVVKLEDYRKEALENMIKNLYNGKTDELIKDIK